MDNLYIDKFPLPALQEVLFKLHRFELNKVCNLSKRAKKICDNRNFQQRYNLLHPIYTDIEVIANLPHWIKNTIHDTNQITLTNIINFLLFVEEKTIDNKDRIIFYGEEVFSSYFVEKVSKLQAGFIAKSLFVGIIGSIVVEDILEPGKLEDHITLYAELSDGRQISLYGFLSFLYENYENYSAIFNLDDTFITHIYTRIADNGIEYKDETITSKLENIDVWNMKRILTTI